MASVSAARNDRVVPPERRDVLISAAILGLAALLAYANSFSVPLLFDDWVTIQHNPQLRQLWPIWSAFSPPESTGVGGRPVANLSFVLNYALTGESVRGMHAVNLAIHFLAGLTLFGIVRRTLLQPQWRERFQRGAGSIALAAAALWMLQPVQTQSVTYVSQRTESLMGLFYFLTLYAFVRGVEAGSSRRWFGLAVVSCFAGIGTKEGMVTAPVIVLLYDFAFVSGSLVTALRRRWALYGCLALSWVLLAVLMSGLRGRGVGFGLGMSWWSYLLIECRAIMHYLSLAFWPAPLVFDYGVDLGSPGFVEGVAALSVLALGISTLLALWRAPAVGFLGAWFLITLAPTSSVVPIPLQPISENRIYVPTAAALTALALVLHHLCGRRGLRASFVVALIFVYLTAARNRDYGSEIKLWADTVAKRPDSSRAHSNLGFALQGVGRTSEALSQHEIAVQLRPDYAEAHVNMAAILGPMGQVDRGIVHSRRAVEIDPRNANGYINLGVGLTEKGDFQGAIAAYESAVRLRASPEAYANLALLFLRVGRIAEATVQAETALRLRPNLVPARFAIACAFAMSGRLAEAVPHFQEIIRAQPNHVDARQNLGTVLLQMGKPLDAIPILEGAMQVNPQHAAVRFGLGNAFLAVGRVDDAIREYTATLGLIPPNADVHLALGRAMVQANRHDEAVANLETAVRLNPQLKAASDALAELRRGGAARPP